MLQCVKMCQDRSIQSIQLTWIVGNKKEHAEKHLADELARAEAEVDLTEWLKLKFLVNSVKSPPKM